MSRKQSSRQSVVRKPSRRLPVRRILAITAVAAGVLLIFFGAGFAIMTTLEDHDSFCASCHTVPESTYVDRSIAATSNSVNVVSDLASAHFRLAQAQSQGFQCIRCHRGDSSLGERIATLALGARDTLVFISGRADPAIEKPTIAQPFLVNTACVSCHEETLLTLKGFQSHFHNFLPQTAALINEGKTWINGTGGGRMRGNIETLPIPITCTTCHLAHKTVDASESRLKLVDKATAQTGCDMCHQAVGERRQSIDRLLNGAGD